MTVAAPFRALTLGVHPSSRGFGWVVFENPLSVYQSRLFEITRAGKDPNRKNAECLAAFEKLLAKFMPEFVVFEAFDAESSLRSARIRDLCLAMVSAVAESGGEFAVYKRTDVQTAFAVVGAKTRNEIAEAVVRMLPVLAIRYPGERKDGDALDRRHMIFRAAAVVLTHYHFGSTQLLDELRDAP